MLVPDDADLDSPPTLPLDPAAAEAAQLALREEVVALRARLERERERRTEAEEQFAFLRGALDHSSEAMMITAAEVTPPARKILYVNPAFCAMMGYAPDEVLGASPRLLWGGSSDPSVMQAMRQSLDTARSFHGETWSQRKDGREILLAQHVAPVRNADGLVRYFVSILRDVTAERVAQAAQRREDAAQHQARRLEALGRLSSGIVHDFNNLLAVLLGNAELLAESTSGEERELVDEMLRAAQHGRALTNQLLVFCRRETSEPQDIDVDDAARDALQLLRRLLGDGVRIETCFAAEAARVRIDRTQFGQVVMNLCLNARDAMPSGGRLMVHTASDAQRVTLTIRDDGMGMSAAVRAQLFEPFFTTKAPGEGSGIGLATVLSIVEANGGELQVSSSLGEGTSMRVMLPRVADVTEQVATAMPERVPASRSARLLLVEDDAGLRRVVEFALTRAGYDVSAAASPGDALLLAEHDPRTIDLVLTDVAMPYLDGPSLVARLREMRPGLGAMYMSAHAEPEVLRACGGDVLAKPFTITALLASVAARLR